MKIGKTLLYILIAAGLLGGGAYIISKNQKETNKQTAIIASSNAEIPANIVTASLNMLVRIILQTEHLHLYRICSFHLRLPEK